MNQEINTTPPTAPVDNRPPQKLDLKQILKNVLTKIYSNKKIFWLLVVLFSLIFLIIIAGLIFKLTSKNPQLPRRSPSPAPLNISDLPEEEQKPLDLAREELEVLDKKIKDFDINQKRLSPPTIDFKIEF